MLALIILFTLIVLLVAVLSASKALFVGLGVIGLIVWFFDPPTTTDPEQRKLIERYKERLRKAEERERESRAYERALAREEKKARRRKTKAS